jgi:hypothetical protein
LILVETNVLVDLVTDDPSGRPALGDPLWGEWSQWQLDRAAAQDELAINDIVYAELSVGYSRLEELDDMIREVGFVTAAIPRVALFLASKAFQQYRPVRRPPHWGFV